VRLCVAHLVRAANGLQPFHAFLDSYRTQPAGRDHELVLLLKGFESDAAAQPYLDAAADITSEVLRVSDVGLDLSAYFTLAGRLDAGAFCFLNSHSRVLARGWLEHLAAALERPGAGVAAATGSWGSQLDYLRYQLGLRSPYAAVYQDREATHRGFLAMSPGARYRGVGARGILSAWTYLRQLRRFGRFPAPHVRTNAFVIHRETLLGLELPHIRGKLDAYAFESGRRSLTAQVQTLGLRALVVGGDGRAYDVRDWPDSATLWQGDQENLLVADNQTASYANADLERRTLLSRYAWADRARPAPPVL
jgi:hypothetical protein